MLKKIFTELLNNYATDQRLINEWWKEIETTYSAKRRHYHTLVHLESLYLELIPIKDKIEDWDIMLFTLCYHDIVYDALKGDNEAVSANFAATRLKQLLIEPDRIGRCKAEIIATQKHLFNPDPDINFFTDADLSILGKPWEQYLAYSKNVRKEYAIYPAVIYNPGRKKVLQHFLAMDCIYKTAYFQNKFEQQAKINLLQELELLS